jgi:hypothetical protein
MSEHDQDRMMKEQARAALAAMKQVIEQVDIEAIEFGGGGDLERTARFNCKGSFGTFGTLTGCFGTFGTFGCGARVISPPAEG